MITIKTSAGDKTLEPTKVNGVFAVHPRWGQQLRVVWTITHIPTGLGVWHVASLGEGEAVARYLEKGNKIPTDGKLTEQQGQQLRKELLAIAPNVLEER